MRRTALLVALVLLVPLAARADDPVAQFRLESGSPHAGVPFVLDLIADGFDQTPAPAQPTLTIPGATVTPLGAQPNVSRSIQIINGQRSDFTRVEWVFRWRIVVDKAGPFRVPTVTLSQGAKHATATGGERDVDTVPLTEAMKLTLALPDRPVFVGETIDATLTWLFRGQPQDQTFTVPLATTDAFTVSAPPATDPRKVIQIDAGDKQLQLPYEIDQTTVDGQQYNRVRIHLFAAPRTSGEVTVPPASVVAALPVGEPDFFGNAATRLFRAVDVPHALEVKPLPETGRPDGFAGAVGGQFSIAVTASRSVVQLGEPVDLTITVKSDERLDALALGRLDGPGGLPKAQFTVPAEQPTGELSEDGKTKTFKVTAEVVGPATEVPALAFSYFDPVKGTYQTIHSDPIALSVKNGKVVGANDAIAATPSAPAAGAGAASANADTPLVGADLALSAPGEDGRPLSGGLLWALVALLYAIPLGVFVLRRWQLGTQTQREEAAEARAARKKLEAALSDAARSPAREAAGPVAAALRGVARALGRDASDAAALLAKIETESFAPEAASAPLSRDVCRQAEELARTWSAEARRRRGGRRAGAAAVGVALVFALAPRATAAAPAVSPAPAPTMGTAPAPDDVAHAIADARAAYKEALDVKGATERQAAFVRVEAMLGAVAREAPDRPALLTDWGNAALGAGDVATATLAYRRALAIDRGDARAARNLAWLRSRQDAALRPSEGSAADTLFFFHAWTRARRLIVGATAFALAVLLLVPWNRRRRRGLATLAAVPFAVWLAMTISLLVEDNRADDAVVMDSVVLRAADSAGAPAALTEPLPRGTEVTIVEQRDAWTKIRLASGTTGWIAQGVVEKVAP